MKSEPTPPPTWWPTSPSSPSSMSATIALRSTSTSMSSFLPCRPPSTCPPPKACSVSPKPGVRIRQQNRGGGERDRERDIGRFEVHDGKQQSVRRGGRASLAAIPYLLTHDLPKSASTKGSAAAATALPLQRPFALPPRNLCCAARKPAHLVEHDVIVGETLRPQPRVPRRAASKPPPAAAAATPRAARAGRAAAAPRRAGVLGGCGSSSAEKDTNTRVTNKAVESQIVSAERSHGVVGDGGTVIAEGKKNSGGKTRENTESSRA